MGKYVGYVILILVVLFAVEYFGIFDIPFFDIPDYLSGKEGMMDKTEKAMEQLKGCVLTYTGIDKTVIGVRTLLDSMISQFLKYSINIGGDVTIGALKTHASSFQLFLKWNKHNILYRELTDKMGFQLSGPGI